MRRTVFLVLIVVAVALSPRLIGSGSGGGITAPEGDFTELTAAPEGGWTWFTDPRAVYDSGSDKTFFGYLRGSDGSVVVAEYDHATETVSDFVLSSALEIDDHDNPSIHIRASDSRLLAFYSKHDDTTVRYRVSTNPLDISAWGSEQEITNKVAGTYTYTMPVELTGDTADSIRVFYRNRVTATSEAGLHYNHSSDGGSTWGAAVHLHRLVYTKIAETADQIHFLASDHPRDTSPSVYHFYLDFDDGEFHQTDGTIIDKANLAFEENDMTLVYDGSTTEAWIHDIAMDGETPVAVFATFPGNDGSDHRYQYARWSGSAWNVTEIAEAGGTIHPDNNPAGSSEEHYSGGVVLDHSDPNVVYASREVASSWEMFRYTTADNGASFTSEQLTNVSSVKNIRPVVVRDHASDLAALWMRGRYDSYVDHSVGTGGTSD